MEDKKMKAPRYLEEKSSHSIDEEMAERPTMEERAKKALDKKMAARSKDYSMGELPLPDTEARISALEIALAAHLKYHFGGVTPPK
jgi:hypothetical protein